MPSFCIPIHVPILVDGEQTYAASSWMRALELLRDSFAGHFDRFILVSPSQQITQDAPVMEPIGTDDGFDVRLPIPVEGSKRLYWLQGDRKRWRHEVARALDDSEFANTVMDHLYRPLSCDAAHLALKKPVTTAFFMDTDTVVQARDLIASGVERGGPDKRLYIWKYDRVVRHLVSQSDLTFLKGRALFDRYAPISKMPKMFQDTSYSLKDVVSEETVEARIAARDATTPLRFVYCGRLVKRKGLNHSIDIVARARAMGADVTLDIIGMGNQSDALKAQVAALGLEEAVRFLGEFPYDRDLINRLAAYDGLLFTPLSEDTPRMIFDGYAAGLPLVGYDIPYVLERAAEEGATHVLPGGQIEAAAAEIAGLAGQPDRIAALGRAALKAAHQNAVEVWYQRRAEWSLEAHAKAQAARRAS